MLHLGQQGRVPVREEDQRLQKIAQLSQVRPTGERLLLETGQRLRLEGAQLAIHKRQAQLGLIGKAAIERALAHASGLGDLSHADVGDTVLSKEALGRLQD